MIVYICYIKRKSYGSITRASVILVPLTSVGKYLLHYRYKVFGVDLEFYFGFITLMVSSNPPSYLGGIDFDFLSGVPVFHNEVSSCLL
jgi:hypothetical protein